MQLGQVLGKEVQEVMFMTFPKKEKKEERCTKKQIFFYFKLFFLNIRGLSNLKKKASSVYLVQERVQEAKSEYYISPRNAFDNR